MRRWGVENELYPLLLNTKTHVVKKKKSKTVIVLASEKYVSKIILKNLCYKPRPTSRWWRSEYGFNVYSRILFSYILCVYNKCVNTEYEWRSVILSSVV